MQSAKNRRDESLLANFPLYAEIERYARSRGRSLPDSDVEDIVSVALASTFEATRSGRPMPRHPSWPAAEDEALYLDAEIDLFASYAKRVIRGLLDEVGKNVRRSKGTVALVNGRDAVPYEDDVAPRRAATEDCLLGVIDANRDATRGAKPLTKFEAEELEAEVQATSARRYFERTGTAWSAACVRSRARKDIAETAPDAITGALMSILAGNTTALTRTTRTTVNDVIDAEVQTFRKAFYRARRVCPLNPSGCVDSVGRTPTVHHEPLGHEAARRIQPRPPARARAARRRSGCAA